MKKKIITIFMASMLAVTSLAGCASSESEKGGEDKAKEEGKVKKGTGRLPSGAGTQATMGKI